MPHAQRFALAACLALSALGCAERSTLQPPVYPSLSDSATTRTWEPDRALTPLALACRAHELPRPNAVDDDCDGKVDALASARGLTVEIAWAAGAELEVSFIHEGKAIQARPQNALDACNTRDGLARFTRTFDELPAEGAELVLSYVRPCNDAERVTVVIAAVSPAGARSYTTSVAPGGRVVLGRVAAH